MELIVVFCFKRTTAKMNWIFFCKVRNASSQLFVRNYAGSSRGPTSLGLGKANKLGQFEEKIKIDVEKDAKKLVTYVCGTNLLAEGEEDVKIKPDSEYPDWLWSLHTGEPLPLEKLDRNTKAYWNRVRKLGRLQESRLLKLQKHKTLQK